MHKKRIGIYGGTFAPIHSGHIKTALAFLSQAELDLLYIVPSNIPPHKAISSNDDPKKRLEMVKLAFEDHQLYGQKIFVSDFEIRQKGQSFTYLTLEHFKSDDSELLFLCGTDMFLTLDMWRHPEKIFESCTIAHARRPVENSDLINIKKDEYKKNFGAELFDIIDDPIDISSTELRLMIEKNLDVSKYIPQKVIKYISDNDLYKGK